VATISFEVRGNIMPLLMCNRNLGVQVTSAEMDDSTMARVGGAESNFTAFTGMNGGKPP